MKTITILRKCLPPPHIDFIQDSSTLMECLQILEKFCARETLKPEISTETENTTNTHRRNSRIQRQGKGNRNLPSNQDSEKEQDEKKSSTTQQLS